VAPGSTRTGSRTTGIDDQDCGSCGLICPTGSTCQNDFPAGCVTANVEAFCADAGCPPQSVCGPQGLCLTTSCDGDDAACPLSDGAVGICCNGGCVDPGRDSNNCNACGFQCPAGEFCANGTCRAGYSCANYAMEPYPQFGGNLTPCPRSGQNAGECCYGSCVDILSDPNNCGTCDILCPQGATCVDGACVQADGAASTCSASTPCTAAGTCIEGACFAASCSELSDGNACAADGGVRGMCCEGACVDSSSDPLNCGVCDLACAGGATCTFGYCSGGVGDPEGWARSATAATR
jgi:hypothetical protein